MLLAIDFTNLHEILQVLYQDMMPLCEKLTGVAKGIAGLGALFYVAAKVWQALARAEPIDVYPLLRPFAIGLCIQMCIRDRPRGEPETLRADRPEHALALPLLPLQPDQQGLDRGIPERGALERADLGALPLQRDGMERRQDVYKRQT